MYAWWGAFPDLAGPGNHYRGKRGIQRDESFLDNSVVIHILKNGTLSTNYQDIFNQLNFLRVRSPLITFGQTSDRSFIFSKMMIIGVRVSRASPLREVLPGDHILCRI